MGRFRAVFFVLPFLLLGCGVARQPSAEWVRRQGGLDYGDRLWRTETLFRRLVGSPPGERFHVHVLASDELSAHSWRDGSVFVTRGLVDRLSDDELLAAMSHELGHLVGDGHGVTGVSLRGCEAGGAGVDEEERADALGVELLQARRVPGLAMASMLAKVAGSEDPASSCGRALARRIDVLASRLDGPD